MSEIFINPTIKDVIFQIKFPNLFSIEKFIGDFQIKIMRKFPESDLLMRRSIMVADIGPEMKMENLPSEIPTKKIWQFRSNDHYSLNVTTDSLEIFSQHHKTYDNTSVEDNFRNIIYFVLDNFVSIIPIPIIHRIGLRYVDICPVPNKENETFKSYYNSSFPLERFNMESVTEMDFKTVIKKGEHSLRYIESLQIRDNECKLILDFDAFSEKIEFSNYKKVTDELHNLIVEEWDKTIKEPVREFMRKKEG